MDADRQKVQSNILQCEPIVKIEPPEDIKDIHNEFFNTNLSSTSLWSYLLKTARYKYQKEHGKKMDCVKMTKLLLIEVEHLMDEVSTFVRSICNSQIPSGAPSIGIVNENVIDISARLSQAVLLPANVTQIQVNAEHVIPTSYKDSIFAPLQKKELDIMDVEQSMIHSVFQDAHVDPDDDDDDDDLDNLATFPEPIDLPDDFKLEAEAFPPMSTSGFPEPTLVPGKEGGKIKTFYKCEKCHKSFPKRKRYYNHKFNGKCTIEPKWIR